MKPSCCPKLDHWNEKDKEFKRQVVHKERHHSNESLEKRVCKLEAILIGILKNQSTDINVSINDSIYDIENSYSNRFKYLTDRPSLQLDNSIRDYINQSKKEQQEYTLRMVRAIKETLEATMKSQLEVFELFINESVDKSNFEINKKFLMLEEEIKSFSYKIEHCESTFLQNKEYLKDSIGLQKDELCLLKQKDDFFTACNLQTNPTIFNSNSSSTSLTDDSQKEGSMNTQKAKAFTLTPNKLTKRKYRQSIIESDGKKNIDVMNIDHIQDQIEYLDKKINSIWNSLTIISLEVYDNEKQLNFPN